MRTFQKSLKVIIFSIAWLLVFIPYGWSQSEKQSAVVAPGTVQSKTQEAPESATAALKQFKADSPVAELNEMRLSVLKLKAELESGTLNADEVSANNEKIASLEKEMTPYQIQEREMRMELQNKQVASDQVKQTNEVKQPAQNVSVEERQKRMDLQTKQAVTNERQQMSPAERQKRQDAQNLEYEAIKRNYVAPSSRQATDNTQLTAPVNAGPQDARYANLPSVIAMKNYKDDSPVARINDLRWEVLQLKFHVEAGQLKNAISQEEVSEYSAKIANAEAEIQTLLPQEKNAKSKN